MKTLLIGALFASLSLTAFADGTVGAGQKQKQEQSSSSTSDAAAQVTGNTTQGVAGSICVGQCVEQDTSKRDLTDVQIAAIHAQAARDVAGTTQTIKNTPSVSGPALTTSNDTCMGSTSGSLNIAGLGVGGGTSWVDANCKMLKNSRELWNMGMKAASLALMCTDAANREALEITGFICPQTAAKNKQVAASTGPVPAVVQASAPASSGGYQGNDPIIKARLGLN